MAKNIPTSKRSADVAEPSATLRARAGRFAASRQRSLLGLPEIIALAVAAVMLACALASYFLYLRPQRARLAQLSEEQRRLGRQLESERDAGQDSESTQASVERILTSITDFESQHLGENTQQSAWDMVGKLNELLRRHGLERNAKLSYTPFAVRGTDGPRQTFSGVSKPIQAVFPGIGISLTVEGPYQSLRRFIADTEADKRFIVINSVELEGITDTGALGITSSPAAPGAAPAPSTTSRGALVSLRLDMAAYFRRGASDETPPDASGATR